MMTTSEVANGLVELCKAGKLHEAMETYYAEDIVSIEAAGEPRQVQGMEAVRGKGQWWQDNHETHSMEIGGPMLNGDQFAVSFSFDVTYKPENKRFVLDEVGIYTVRDGKIVEEKFFYNVG